MKKLTEEQMQLVMREIEKQKELGCSDHKLAVEIGKYADKLARES